MTSKLTTILAIAIAVMGVVHIIATFTPLIGGGLEQLPHCLVQKAQTTNLNENKYYVDKAYCTLIIG